MNQPRNFNPVELILPLEWEESGELEFKSARGGFPKSLWESYSAMANMHGGVILLGVEDNGDITGITDPVKFKKTLWDTINNRGKVNVNLLSESDVATLKHDGKTILAIRVPQASRYQKPVYLGQNPLLGTYRRNYEGDYRCSEQEVKRMFSDSSDESADSRILEHFGIQDIDTLSLQQYRNRFRSHKLNHPWINEDDKGLLIKLGAWRHDRKNNQEGLTVAGLLMFGTDDAIREALPQYHVDYREKMSADPAIRWTDRLTIDGTWQPNLFQFYTKVILRLYSDLKTPFVLDKDLFRKGEAEVHEAVREALVNALIHADYAGMGGIVIEKLPHRFIFSNPGTLLVSLDQLLQGNISECRNKALQTMFTMIGVAEKAGSGMDKIRKGWESQHWRTPFVKEQTQPDRVYWELPMMSLIPEESEAHLQALFGDEFRHLSKMEVQALVTADVEGFIDNMRLRQVTGNHATDITRILQGLVSKGALVQEGRTRGTRYRLPNSVHNELYSPHKQVYSPHKGISGYPHKRISGYPHKHDDSPDKDIHLLATKDVDLFDSYVEGEQESNANLELLRQISAPARKNKRLPPKRVEQIIKKLCNGRWLSRRQLSELMNRNMEGLRMRFLMPMVEHGLLELRYPDKPNRVDQAYTLAKKLAE